MESKNKNVISIDRNDRDALAKKTGMTVFEAKKSPASRPEHKRRRIVTALGVAAAVLGVGWLAGPRSHDAPQPGPKSFGEQVADSAKQPYNPTTDEMVINGLRVKAGNPNLDTPSEAVLNNSVVKAFEKAHPNEVSSITTSAMSLPGGKEAGIVMRDVDHDGDKDAIAVEVEK